MASLCKIVRTLNIPCRAKVPNGRGLADCGKKSGGGDHDQPACDPCCGYPIICSPGGPTLYDSRKYGHLLPGCAVPDRFESVPCIPNGIFRCTAGEQLGPCADKCGFYPCPEYFSYNHMTYYDVHLILCPCRNCRPRSLRKPN